ncbi:DUF2062 domain-containing protein [Alteriqipengyuania flavescens]|uniref:DUF2062 domain-containing protein n=1 Tax=Alteriqipengyuania flavescens TaxID=3053610 RepID=UPI0025B32720|nr:DUF2062 domain-containing protein [Alteriqipengyuania flavescens]WJY18002.1 DUF2062 domain-containing protein [Alteriqipengyuania flavescens]WJY23943.1 DUF2062 domain-containing protein [Alteriqipengyuania flavescens]
MNRKRSKDTVARWIGARMPTREEMARNKYLKPIAHRFLSPELWRFTRRSVPRGVALGLFCGFIIPIGQIFLAAFLALPARANMPISALVTFVTNPLTFPFWAWIANRVGDFMLGLDRSVGSGVIQEQMQTEGWRSYQGVFAAVGETVFGFVILAIVTSAVGYFVSKWFWRWKVGRRRTKRLQTMERRMEERLEAQKG